MRRATAASMNADSAGLKNTYAVAGARCCACAVPAGSAAATPAAPAAWNKRRRERLVGAEASSLAMAGSFQGRKMIRANRVKICLVTADEQIAAALVFLP